MAKLELTLYVVRGTANSSRAEQNLETIMNNFADGPPELSIVDLTEDPQRAIRDGVLVTPTLVCRPEGNNIHKVVGTLDNVEWLGRQIRHWTDN